MKNILKIHILLALSIYVFWVSPCYSQSKEFTYYQIIDNKLVPLKGTYKGVFSIKNISQDSRNLDEELLKTSGDGNISLTVTAYDVNQLPISPLIILNVSTSGSLSFHSDNHSDQIFLSYSGKPEDGIISFQLSSPVPDSFQINCNISFSINTQEVELTGGGGKEQLTDSENQQNGFSSNSDVSSIKDLGESKEVNQKAGKIWTEANTLEKVYAYADQYGMNADVANRVNRMTQNLEIYVDQIEQSGDFRFFKFKESKEFYFPFSPVKLELKEGNPQGILYPQVIDNSGMGFQIEVLKSGKYIFGIKDKYGKTGLFRFDSNYKLPELRTTPKKDSSRFEKTLNEVITETSEIEPTKTDNSRPEIEPELAQTNLFDTVREEFDSVYDDFSSESLKDNEKTKIISASLSSNALLLEISGEPPFTVFLKSVVGLSEDNQPISLVDKYLVDTVMSNRHNSSFFYAIPRDFLDNHFSGTYKLSLQDANKLGDIYSESIIIGELNDDDNNTILIVIGFGALLALFILIPLLRSLKLKDVRENPQEEFKPTDNNSNNSSQSTLQEKMVIKSRNDKRPRSQSEKAKNEGPPKTYTNDLNSENKGKGYDPDDLEKCLHSSDYCKLNMLDLWENTAVEWVLWDRNCLIELNDFIKEHNNTEFSEEPMDGIPEIGGFILGKYTISREDARYWVLLKKFVPVKAVQQGRYQIEFGVAWAGNQLAEVQDQYKDLETLAWFHTHPGHGLFLSHADLNIHQGFFQKRYQLAIEIDTVSKDLDTAIFTRTKTGSVNNARDLHPDVSWFRWHDILKGGNIPV